MIKNIVSLFLRTLVLAGLLLVIMAFVHLLDKTFHTQLFIDWINKSVLQIVIIIISLTTIAIFSKGKELGQWGLRMCKFTVLVQSFFVAIIVNVIGSLLRGTLLFTSIDMNSFSRDQLFNYGEYTSVIQYFLIISVLVPIAEEFLFRGFFQTYIRKFKFFTVRVLNIELTFPVIYTAFLFGIVHLAGKSEMHMAVVLTGVVKITVLGIYFGYLREKHNSILPSIVAHGALNLTGFHVMKFILSIYEHIHIL